MTASVHVLAGPTLEERQQHVEAARKVMSRPDIHTRAVLRDAAQVLRAWGDFTDQIMCDAVIYAMDKEDWDAIDRRMSEVHAQMQKQMDRDRMVAFWFLVAASVIAAVFIVLTLGSWA